MSFYTMRRLSCPADSRVGERCYASRDGRLFVSVHSTDEQREDDFMTLCRARVSPRVFAPSRAARIYLETLYLDGGGNVLFLNGRDPFGGVVLMRPCGFNPSFVKSPNGRLPNFARLFPDTAENERALVAEAAAMYRDGVAWYDAQGVASSARDMCCLDF